MGCYSVQMNARTRGWIYALALVALAPAARADGLGAAALPVAAIPAITVIGGLLTTPIVATSMDQKIHPALRNITLGCAGGNVLFGTTGLIVTAVIADDDLAPLAYSLSGATLALGLVGGTLGLVADTYTPTNELPTVVPTGDGALLVWSGAF